tara:strand:- start:31 stop:1194 length:1164 start_codon:yes stop_codon:yes gene_type:complete
MRKLLLLLAITLSNASYSQTAITDANIQNAINTCLSTNPVDGMCTDSEYGAMPDWDVSQVTDMSNAFENKNTFNGDISSWDTSSVTDMNYMFADASAFNQDIGAWDVGNVINFERVFEYASAFNQPIGDWDVSSVTNIRYMFHYATSFNQPIGDWDVSSITPYGATTGAFENADSFNQDLSGWDVSNMTAIASMFNSADSFNQDLSSWDVSNITNMNWTFNSASSFNQNLSEWNIGNVNTMGGCFKDSGLSTVNYDNILIGWSEQELQSDVQFGAQNINYCNGADAKQSIIDTYGWIITDGGLDCSSLGIDDQNLSNISIYPNPTDNTLFISGNETPITVAIFNVLGKEVLSIKNTNNINVQALQSGVYVIRISDGLGQTNRKFIRN